MSRLYRGDMSYDRGFVGNMIRAFGGKHVDREGLQEYNRPTYGTSVRSALIGVAVFLIIGIAFFVLVT